MRGGHKDEDEKGLRQARRDHRHKPDDRWRGEKLPEGSKRETENRRGDMSDLEKSAMERLRMASEMSLRLYKQPNANGGDDR